MYTKEYTFKNLTAADLERDVALWQIYSASFPAAERKLPRDLINAMKYKGMQSVSLSHENITIGCAFFYILKHAPVVFLEYLAIDPHIRSKGLGERMFNLVLDTGAQSFSGTQNFQGMVWEVEKPELDTADVARTRRMAFYQKLGGKILSTCYFMPALKPDVVPIAMYLMCLPAKGVALQSQDAEFAQQVTAAIHQECYSEYIG